MRINEMCNGVMSANNINGQPAGAGEKCNQLATGGYFIN